MPRFESSGCSPNRALGEKNANCFTVSKWQIPLPLVEWHPPLSRGCGLPQGERERKVKHFSLGPPQGVQERSPWRAFGDFRRETKVTRVPSMARPCSRGAPAYRGPQGPPPLQSPRGGPQSPLYLYPETNKKLHPNVQPARKKSPLRGEKSALRSS